MRFTEFLFVAGVTLLLSGCCLSGTTEQPYDVWTSPTLSSSKVNAIERHCDADARQAAGERFDAHVALLKQQCSVEHPFASIAFRSQATGKPFEGQQRERVLRGFLDACRMMSEKPHPTPDDFVATCSDCKPRLPADACYEQHGLVRETRYRTMCAPFKVF